MSNKVTYIHRGATSLTVFYVGMGDMKRAYNFKTRSIKWKERVAAENGVIVEIVAKDVCSVEAYLYEMLLIDKYRTVLVNSYCGASRVVYAQCNQQLIEEKLPFIKQFVDNY